MPEDQDKSIGFLQGFPSVMKSYMQRATELGPVQEALHPISAIKGYGKGLYDLFNTGIADTVEGAGNYLINDYTLRKQYSALQDQYEAATKAGDTAGAAAIKAHGDKISQQHQQLQWDTLGKVFIVPHAYKEALADQISKNGPPQTEGESFGLKGRAAIEAAKSVLPVSELWQSMTGYSADGKKLTPEEIGQLQAKATVKGIALKALKSQAVDPVIQGMQSALGKVPEATATTASGLPTPSEKVVTKAEILANLNDKGEGAAAKATPKPAATPPEAPAGFAGAAPEATPPPAPDPDFAAQFTRGGLTNPKVQQLLTHAVADALADKVDPGTRFFRLVGKQIAEGNIPPEASQDVLVAAMRTGMSVEEATSEYANVYMDTVSKAGSLLQQHQQLAAGLEKALSDMGPEGAQALAAWKNITGQAVKPGIYSTVNQQFIKPMIQLWRGSIISAPRTAAKITEQHLMNGVGKFFEDSLANTIEAAGNTFGGTKLGKYFYGDDIAPRSFYDTYADTIGDFVATFHRFSPSGRQLIGNILDQLPKINRDMEGRGSLQEFMPAEIRASIMGKPALQSVTDGITNILTYAHQIAQVESRRWFFDSQLYGKLNDIGLTQNQLLEGLRNNWEGWSKDKIGAAKAAILSARDTALGETLSKPATNSFMQSYIRLANDHPILFPTGPLGAFPRLLANQFRWLSERSPHLMMEALDPEVRSAIVGGAKDAWSSGNAAHAIARGISGATYMSLAWVMQNSDMAGPTFHQVWTGERDKNGDPRHIDIMGYHPLPMYMAIARAAWDKANNLPVSLGAKDYADLFLGLKNYKSTGVFMIPEIIQNLQSSGDLGRAIERAAGTFLSGYAMPVQWMYDLWKTGEGTVRKIEGQSEPIDPLSIQRDVTGQELTGPVKARIPVLAETLPPRINPTNGEVIRNDQMGRRQLYADAPPMTKLEQIIARTPNLSEKDLLPYYDNAKLQNYVAANMGMILSKTGYGDRVAQALASTNDPDMRKLLLDKMISPVRQHAELSAERDLPLDMKEYKIKHMPKVLQKQYEPIIRKLKASQGVTQ